MMALGCVTGRFQPIHDQHLELFAIALAHCEHLIIAVTNPDSNARHAEASSAHRHTAAANPFTYFERARLIDAAMNARGLSKRYTLVPFNLVRTELWTQYVPLDALHFVRAYSAWERDKAQRFEEAGYRVSLLEGDSSRHQSASTIRDSMRAGNGDWHQLVPTGTRALLQQLLEQTPMSERR
jgi:nicotinamide-nucleotide adenylyltransferase